MAEQTETGMLNPVKPEGMADFDELAQLRQTNAALELRVYELREENRQVRLRLTKVLSERDRLNNKIDEYKNELEKIHTHSLMIGTVEQVLSDNRLIFRSSAGPLYVSSIVNSLENREIKPGMQCAVHPQTMVVLDILSPHTEAFISAMEIDERPAVSYEDIGGLDIQIRQLRESVELPLTSPELFEQVGIEPPKGVLLCGAPGTGKTMVAKAAAHATSAVFIRVVASELVQKYIGEGSRMVRELFAMAREKAPSIIFIDELDAVGQTRSSDAEAAGDREVGRTLIQLLAEMDGFTSRGNVRIIAATNRKSSLDEALLRPGRFDRIIEFPLPDAKARAAILRLQTKTMHLAKDTDFDLLASDTYMKGFSGAEIAAVAVEAGMTAIRESRTVVCQSDFLSAVSAVMNGRSSSVPDIPEGVYW